MGGEGGWVGDTPFARTNNVAAVGAHGLEF